MNTPSIPPDAAAAALADVRARREQATNAALTPFWFWPLLGALTVVFIAAMEVNRSWLTPVGAILACAGHAVLINTLVLRSRAQIRYSLLGVRGARAIGGFAAALAGLGIATAIALHALNIPWPATIAGSTVAVALTIGGPLLMRHLRRLVNSSPIGEPA
jgi:hypothetical protein